MKKREKLHEILKNAGVKEYWVGSGFNPDEDYPSSTILLPIEDIEVLSSITELYNDLDDDDKCNFHVRGIEDIELLNRSIELGRLEKRYV